MTPHPHKAPDEPGIDGRARTTGFTLVEMLVVVAVIAILAALFIPILRNVMNQSSRAKAAGNFRQLGASIMTYTADHDGRLPGPLQQNQRSGYRKSLGNGIGVKLWEYMNITEPSDDFQNLPLLTVSALSNWKYSAGDPYPSAYYVIRDAPMPGGDVVHPFGLGGANRREPAKISQIPKPASTWAIWEKGGLGDPILTNRKNFSEPIHGKLRVVLFLDGHVEVVPSEELPDYLNP